MPRLAILTLTALLLLAGCTSSDGDGDKDGSTNGSKPSAGKTTAAPKGPDCADIWKNGATLPEDYTKCVEGGAYGMQDVTECQDGSKLVAYANAYYAVTGGPISKPDIAPMQDTEEYGKAYSACTGE